LAAGGSSRLGTPKQLLLWRGEPLVRHVVRLAVASGLQQILLITGCESDRVEKAVDGFPVRIVRNPNWQLGQGSSIKVAVKALASDISACLFFMCDQPLIKIELIKKIISVYIETQPGIIVPHYLGKRGNPVLFDQNLFSELGQVPDQSGGRSLFSAHPVTAVESPDDSVLIDVDTMEDYQKLAGMHK
jgi:molybdenum cofactor cytidylyltransferase